MKLYLAEAVNRTRHPGFIVFEAANIEKAVDVATPRNDEFLGNNRSDPWSAYELEGEWHPDEFVRTFDTYAFAKHFAVSNPKNFFEELDPAIFHDMLCDCGVNPALLAWPDRHELQRIAVFRWQRLAYELSYHVYSRSDLGKAPQMPKWLTHGIPNARDMFESLVRTNKFRSTDYFGVVEGSVPLLVPISKLSKHLSPSNIEDFPELKA